MATKRPSLKDRMIEKINSGTARFRTGSTEELSTGSDTENKKSTKTTSWYTHPQPGSIEGQGQTEKVKATEESHSGAVNNGKKPKKVQPADTEEYKVSENDTLASIAAHFDTTPTELQKLNKMFTRNVFAGQTLYVPSGTQKSKSQESLKNSQSPVSSAPSKDVPTMDVPLIKMADKPPLRIPGHAERVPTPVSSPTENKEFQAPHKLSEEQARELDQECYERFIKVNAKHITDGQGVVSGVLLVTPNAVMFDPNVSDPLVLERGSERYGVIAPMDMVVSAAMYHDIAAMKVKGKREGGKKPEVYHDKSCLQFKSWCEGHPNFEVARAASEAGFVGEKKEVTLSTSTNPVKDTISPQSDTASLCSCATSQGEGGMSATSSPVAKDNELIPRPAVAAEDPPLYLCLHLGKPLNKSVSGTAPIQAFSKMKKKPEYWFSIPREKVDQLYAFFVQWKPELYGDEEEISAERRGFVVLEDDDKEDSEEMEVFEEYFNNGVTALQKDWEFPQHRIISAEEAIRRKSVDSEDVLILPELVGTSTIMQDYHLQMLSRYMPARTIGYPWRLIYSTEQHGFSLKTLYRDMQGVDSPVMLVVKDTNDNIFGALTSCELKPSDHFYGTGESFLFTFYPEFKVFKWTGDNNFFIKGNQESLSIGAGQGLFGLWFDGDLYHGQTHRCDTYDNDILTSSEDFIVKVLEAWIFTQD
ncbi:oxidation resistance protein 1-like isoform X5 [Crassostrea angulata]|uniref:oxidation resistance protein 1-like isoform X5 n=1 Tax=Magallana angulata TaxID=2784310 RepID=UPI0022B1244E|nr:oxidation resistance protein 1-like isoform X5 [Crassostrea angulata]